MQNEKKTKESFSFRRLPMVIARLICAPLLLFFRMKRLTPEGTPFQGRIRGGAIIAANHTKFIDPFVVGVAVWYRRLFFLAAEVVMQGKLKSLLLRGVGAVKIDRNTADIEAIRKCVALLKEGELLSIFPEGGIQAAEGVQSLKSGAVLMALQAGVPIVPMHIRPRKHWYQRQVVVIGQPLDPKTYIQKKFPSTADIDMVTGKLMEEMNRCAGEGVKA